MKIINKLYIFCTYKNFFISINMVHSESDISHRRKSLSADAVLSNA